MFIIIKFVLFFSGSRDLINITSIGCYWQSSYSPAFQSLEGKDPRLDGEDYKLRKNAIEKCALVSKELGYKVFAVKDGGKCLSSPTAHKTFIRGDAIKRCESDGRGRAKINHVYVIGDMKSTIDCGFFYFNTLDLHKK